MFLLPVRRCENRGFLEGFGWGAIVGAIIFLIVVGFSAMFYSDTIKTDHTKQVIFMTAAGKPTDDKDIQKAIEILRKSLTTNGLSFTDLKDSLTTDNVKANLQLAIGEWSRLEPIMKDSSAYDHLDYRARDWNDWLILAIKIFLIGLCCWNSLAYWAMSNKFFDFSTYHDVNPNRQLSLTYPWTKVSAILLIPFYLPYLIISQPLLLIIRIIYGIYLIIRIPFVKLARKKEARVVVRQQKTRKPQKPLQKKEVVMMERAKKEFDKNRAEYVKFFRSRIGILTKGTEDELRGLESHSRRLSNDLEDTDRKIAMKETEVDKLRKLASTKNSFTDEQIAQEFNKILSIPGVVALELKDKTLKIYTEPIRVEHEGLFYLIGRLMISFCLVGNGITVKNIDPENGPGDEQHPFAPNESGSFCFGSIRESLTGFIDNMEYYALVAATMTAVRSVDGASSSSIKKWRVAGYAKRKKGKK